MEDIILDYINNIPLKDICTKYKIGKKKLHTLLLNNGVDLRPNKSKLKEFPYYKNQIIDGIEILDNDYFFDGERWTIRFKCRCGSIDFKRPSFIGRENTFTFCNKCSKKNKYPENRKRKDMRESFGINCSWITCIKENLNRGSFRDRILDFNITEEDLYNRLITQNSKCALTGEELKVLNFFKKESNASVDRIDSKKGYVKDNIQWVLKEVNKMKNNFSQEEFIRICNKVSKLHDNFEPNLSNDIKVDREVQRLIDEESNQ